jgi:hypothetical protein
MIAAGLRTGAKRSNVVDSSDDIMYVRVAQGYILVIRLLSSRHHKSEWGMWNPSPSDRQ